MRISDWSSDVCSSDLLSAGSAPVLLTPVETAGLCDIASGADAKRWASDYLDRSQVRPVDARLSEALAAPSDLSTARALADVACLSPSRLREIVCRRSEEHTSELQSLMRISYAVFCLKKKNTENYNNK